MGGERREGKGERGGVVQFQKFLKICPGWI